MTNEEVLSLAPNGGWGWVVVASVCLINMFNQSLMSVFGLLFGDLLHSLGQETTGAALVTNLNCVALNFSGLFIGPAIKSFSPRKVAAAGCILTSSGLMLCALSTQLWHVIIGYSVLFGIGLGLIAPSSFMAINSYFSTKRGIAVGVSLAGTGLGQMVIPHIVRLLLDHYGFQITVLTMGFLALTGLIGAISFRPLEAPKQHNNMKEMKLFLDLKDKPDFEVKVVKNEAIKSDKELIENNTQKLEPRHNQILRKLIEAMDLELLKDPIFLSIIIGMSLIYTATQNFAMLFPYFLQYSTGFSRKETAMCMSVLAFTDLSGRLIIPILSNKLRVPYRNVFLFGTIGAFISRAVMAESTELVSITIASFFYGMMKAATVLTNNLTISDHCRPEKLPGALGLNMISKGVLVMSLGQLLGWMRDHTNSYKLCLHAQNILLGVTILFWLPEILYKYIRKIRKTKNTEQINNSFS
ncbi:monocarboxylate transporter 12 [Condylostylus longicornis]|uniref:monocarboxylate transporter 12 n=1 Tax=Condylostylus longicornis TaxID=2530218 RepID=UPI00244DACF4|nr:monocarboxylate transporter 12 [Condylostylus longicornis]XP_055379710.1 monocarboxylate transporter 12 [Condylostylus longicornis]